VQGSANASTAPGSALALSAGAQGYLDGYLYGPEVDELAAIWSLADGAKAAHGFVASEATSRQYPIGNRIRGFLNTLPNPPERPNGTPAIATPLPAARDASIPGQIALAGGPRFTAGSAPFPSESQMTFPIRHTALTFGASGSNASATSAGARILVDPANQAFPHVENFTLMIPALGVDSFFSTGGFATSSPYLATPMGFTAIGSKTVSLGLFGLDYTMFGAWDIGPGFSSEHTGYFSFGYETAFAAMPTSGTATYSGLGTAGGTVFVPSGTTIGEALVAGNASFTADFAAGSITGNLTDMFAYTTTTTQSWNSVSISANIAGTAFTGTTAAASTAPAPFGLKPSATGHISGGFYGPAANELGAVWSLSNGDGTGSAIGVVGAPRQ
jgi:hypothetical protein